MLQIGNAKIQYAIDTRDFTKEEIRSLLQSIVDNRYAKVIGQNIKFDYKMLLSNYGIRLSNVHDTMVQEMLLHCGKRNYGYSLEKLAERYLKFKYAKTNQLDLFSSNDNVGVLNKSLRKSFKNQGSKPFTYEQYLYGCTDIAFTYLVYERQLIEIIKWGLSLCSWLENSFTLAMAEMEYNGMYIDQSMWVAQYERNVKQREDYKKQIFELIRKENLTQFYDFQMSLTAVNPDDFQGEVDLNLSSSHQVVELCKALGIPTKIKDKKKSREEETDIFKDSVEERHLKKYKNKHPLVKLYLQYKRYEKATTTYGLKFLNLVNPVTGRLHSNYKQILNTGRIASRNPNLQNIPSEGKFPGFRVCFKPSEGKLFVVNDYSSQESRLLAEIADEDTLIDFFNNGDGDLHSFTAKKMFGDKFISKDETPHLRALAKVLNFGEVTPK